MNIDKLGITSLNSEGRFSVYTIDENVSFAGSTVGIAGEVLPSSPVLDRYSFRRKYNWHYSCW